MDLCGLLVGIRRFGSDEKIRRHGIGRRRSRPDASDAIGISIVIGDDVVLVPRGRYREDQFGNLVEVHESADIKNRCVPRIVASVFQAAATDPYFSALKGAPMIVL